MRYVAVRRLSLVLVALALVLTGLAGAYSYWESYYQHRGFAPVALVHGASRGQLVTVHFQSKAMGRRAHYLAYLPPGYDPTLHRYPVYYLLHGSPSRPEAFLEIAYMDVRLDNLVAEHRMRPMILIFPDGRIGGSTFSDSEWANTPSGNYESYVLEVVRNVDRRYATIPDRQHRVIAGFSAGGYGATNIALHHLGVFGNVQSWSGYFQEPRSGVFAFVTPAQMFYNRPQEYVLKLGPQLARYPLRAFLWTGRTDYESPQTVAMAKELAALGASVSYALYRGGHDWQGWHPHLNQMLILASRDVSRPLRRGSGTAKTLTPGVVPHPRPRRFPYRELLENAHKSKALVLGAVGGEAAVRERPHGAAHRHHRGHRYDPRAALPPYVAAAGLGGGPGRRGLGFGELLGGLLLALGSAALINIGFLLQHRGLGERPAGGLAERPPPGGLGGSPPDGRGERPPDGLRESRLEGFAERPSVALPAGERRAAGPGRLEGFAERPSVALPAGERHAAGPAAGAPAPEGLAATLLVAARNPTWLRGQLVGWIGFATQIVAVAIAPLALVQAFAAGGLALSVPLAAGFFSHRITRREVLAVMLIAVCLAALPIGFSTARDHLHGGLLGVTVAVLAVLAIGAGRIAPLRAVAAGMFYGIADAAIKAVSIGWHVHGGSALLSVWTLVAVLATFGGFLTFQAALRDSGAIVSISLMSAFAALVALACGLIAFGESLGATSVGVVAHLAAIGVVLGCVPVLAAAQAEMAEVAEHPDGPGVPYPSSWRPGYGSPG